jgi:hypothetical protein
MDTDLQTVQRLERLKSEYEADLADIRKLRRGFDGVLDTYDQINKGIRRRESGGTKPVGGCTLLAP